MVYLGTQINTHCEVTSGRDKAFIESRSSDWVGEAGAGYRGQE
jgi:hypothetical protein